MSFSQRRNFMVYVGSNGIHTTFWGYNLLSVVSRELRETAHARPPLDRCCGSYTPQFPERPFPASFPPRHGMALTVRGASAWVVRWLLLACLSHTLQGAYCCHCDCIEWLHRIQMKIREFPRFRCCRLWENYWRIGVSRSSVAEYRLKLRGRSLLLFCF